MERYLLAFTLLIASLSVGFGQGASSFITKWETSNIQTTLSFYVEGTGNVNYSWSTASGTPVLSGSGTFAASSTLSDITISGVPSSREIELVIQPANFNRIRVLNCPIGFCNSINISLKEIIQWGDVQWTSMEAAFQRCENVSISATDFPDLSNVTSLKGMFTQAGNASLENSTNFNGWDVSNIIDMSLMFSQSITNFWDMSGMNFSNWNTSQVLDMSDMFAFCSKVPMGLNFWDTGNVVNMSGMFIGVDLSSADISNWNVSSVESFVGTFIFAGIVGGGGL